MDMKGLVEPMQNTNRSVKDMIVTGSAAALNVSAARSCIDNSMFVFLKASNNMYVWSIPTPKNIRGKEIVVYTHKGTLHTHSGRNIRCSF